MKKSICAGVLLAVSSMLSACSVAAPDAGQEAVWVAKPLIFGHGGVNPTPVTTGRDYGALTSTAYTVNMLPQRIDMEFDDMMTKSGVPVSFHVVATYRIIDSVKLVSKFGVDTDDKGIYGFWNRNIDQPLRTAVRDAVKKRDMQEIAISQIAADDVGREVRAAAITIVQRTGVPILVMDINVGRVNPPDAVKNQRIATAEQEQRAITEVQRTIAENSRLKAETSRAAADNAYRAAMSLSPEQFVQLANIQMQEKVCAPDPNNKDAPHSNCTFFVGSAGPAPVYSVH
jgi:hypothetical protein